MMNTLNFAGHQLHFEARRHHWPHGLIVDFELTEASHLFGRIRVLCKLADPDFRSLYILDYNGLITAATERLVDFLNRTDPETLKEGFTRGATIMISWSAPRASIATDV